MMATIPRRRAAAHQDDGGQEDRDQFERRVDSGGQAAGRGTREEERDKQHLDAAHVALPEGVQDWEEPGRGGAEPESRLHTESDGAGTRGHQDAGDDACQLGHEPDQGGRR
jgi:hypothetical protein